MSGQGINFVSAIEDFQAARRQATMKTILARFTGESVRLLSFEEVREKLKLRSSYERGLQDIPLDAIVGSVGRYLDFTRDFLPLKAEDKQRWARVEAAVMGNEGVPPIDVYKIGEVYFVKDGNHRVSVARRFGAKFIQAHVTEIRTNVPLSPDIRPDDLILKAEYAEFLEKTRLNELRAGSNIVVTVPGKYEELLEQIAYHRYDMSIDSNEQLTFEQAAAQWYDTVYMPVVRIIEEQCILRYFPNRTEADMYLWISEHREELEKSLVWEVRAEAAASDLISRFSSGARQKAARLKSALFDKTRLYKLETGPLPGQWRKGKAAQGRQDRLFNDILVPLDGEAGGWNGLEQALVLAQREDARIYGLHVQTSKAHKGRGTSEIEARFNERCSQAGVAGYLVQVKGNITRQISSRAGWMDLVMLNLAHPPAPKGFSRLRSGMRDLLRRCPSPMFITPQVVAPLQKALLAYDGSPKADEALFIATYLSGQWQIPLVVVHVSVDGSSDPTLLDKAREYLERHNRTVEYVSTAGRAAETLVEVSEAYGCDFLVMGGYGQQPFVEVMRGSTVDRVLSTFRKPVLICQ